VTRRWNLIVPAAVGLALSSSLLVAPPAQAAAPVLAPAVASAAVPLATLGAVTEDSGASIWVSPVAYGATGGVQVKFSKANAVKKRPVELQVSSDSVTWAKVAKAKMDKKGLVTFKITPLSGATYRAVAEPFKKKAEVATPAKANLTLTREFGFGGSSLEAEWTTRFDGVYSAKGRNCSAPWASNSVVSGGAVKLSMTVEKEAANIAAAREAGCSSKKQKTIYRNAMLTTEGLFSLKTGAVSARIKFPKQRGVHGGIWLQSHGGPEIDMIESYGLGKGFTNVYHLNGKEYKVYKKSPKSSWFKAYHVFSVEWNSSQVVFRVDGNITKTVKKNLTGTDYFLVMSQLSSDWELNKAKKTTATMTVDWVKVWATS